MHNYVINVTIDYLIVIGPDRLESTILKITGKISLVIYNLLFPKIVDGLYKQIINYFQK